MILFLFLFFLLPLLLTKEKISSIRCLSALSLRGWGLDLSLSLVFG